MLRFSSIVAFIGLVIVLVSCVSKYDYRLYTFPTVFDGETRYYLYEETIITKGKDTIKGERTTKIERVGPNKVVFVEYRHLPEMSLPMDSTVALIMKDGLYNEQSYYYCDGWKPFKKNGKEQTIAWNWTDQKFKHIREVSESMAKPCGAAAYKFKGVTEYLGMGKLKKKFKGNRYFQMRSSNSEITFLGNTNKCVERYWDLEGVGLFRFENEDEHQRFIMRLKEIYTDKSQYEAHFK